MNGIVRIALARPLTFIVMSILIGIVGILQAARTPVDIFPNIGVPVIATAWQYAGLSPDDMSGRIVTPFERVLTTTVNDIDHIESQSMQGIGVVKIYFQPGASISIAFGPSRVFTVSVDPSRPTTVPRTRTVSAAGAGDRSALPRSAPTAMAPPKARDNFRFIFNAPRSVIKNRFADARRD